MKIIVETTGLELLSITSLSTQVLICTDQELANSSNLPQWLSDSFETKQKKFRLCSCPHPPGDAHMKGAERLVENFELNPQRRPIWAWPKIFLSAKRDHFKTQTNKNYSDFPRATLNETFTDKYNGDLPRTP